ncbi:MAG: hypothetical protein M5U31_15540 [Acidimicrobiia bacterium]|nr:hypothetical protein [Acidimicrobiia bacterium]
MLITKESALSRAAIASISDNATPLSPTLAAWSQISRPAGRACA